MKVYTNVVKGLKLKVRKFWELILTFVEVTGKKTSTGGGWGWVWGRGELFGPSAILPSWIGLTINAISRRSFTIPELSRELSYMKHEGMSYSAANIQQFLS